MTSIPSFSRPSRRSAAVTAPSAAGGGRERLWLPLAIVAAALVVLAGWMLLVSPLRSDTSALDDQTATVSQQVDTLRSQISGLQAQQADLPRFKAELKAAQAALPTTAALPAFLRSLQDLGNATGTTVTGLNATAPSAPTDGTGAVAEVGTVYRIPVTLTVGGSDTGLTAFVKGLQETQPRAVLVDSVTETTSESGVTLTLSMTAFVAPTAGSSTSGG